MIGVQYRGNDRGLRKGAWLVRQNSATPCLFCGTGLVPGLHVGRGGIEIDKRAAASPPGLIVLAEILNLFGPGFTAEMTYYRTPLGA